MIILCNSVPWQRASTFGVTVFILVKRLCDVIKITSHHRLKIGHSAWYLLNNLHCETHN